MLLWPRSRNSRGGPTAIERRFRINEQLRVPEVRLVDENGVQVGVIPTREALAKARERSLDLIEVAPQANPPVCRIMDYGKYRYQQARRERESRRRAKATEVRPLRIKSPHIDGHDFNVKLKKIRSFLEEGNKVKVNLFFRGRQAIHPEIGEKVLVRLAEGSADIGTVEMPPRQEGRNMTMVLTPK